MKEYNMNEVDLSMIEECSMEEWDSIEEDGGDSDAEL